MNSPVLHKISHEPFIIIINRKNYNFCSSHLYILQKRQKLKLIFKICMYFNNLSSSLTKSRETHKRGSATKFGERLVKISNQKQKIMPLPCTKDRPQRPPNFIFFLISFRKSMIIPTPRNIVLMIFLKFSLERVH